MATLDFDSFVLAAATDDLSAEPAARDHADAVEFRLDLATDPLDQLDAYGGDLPLIVTNRAAWEGGEADDEAGRLDTLEAALDHEAVAAVDLELGALAGSAQEAATDRARELRSTAREAGVTVIASVHDFESTPSVDRLVDLLEQASDEGDVGKLAVTATDRSDALAVLTATHRAVEAGQTVATMAMGAAGQHTRAVAPVYGSAIGYAPVDPEGATAPGQYDLETLRGLVDQLQ
jgi:3-dehydroquinate dehydratase-1